VSRPRTRALAVAAVGVLTALLAACGSAAEPELKPSPDSEGAALAAPTTTVAPPTTVPPTTTPPPTTTTAPRTTTPKPKPAAAAHQAVATPGIAWVAAGGDEFAGGALGGQWNAYDSVGAFNNGRRTPSAVTVADGLLTITGSSANGGTSGGIGMKTGQLYGRWEFRARTDKGVGFGSAILLWPDSEKWPDDGELDMMEVPGAERNLAHTIIHWGADNQTFGGATPGDFSQWHTFAFEWLPDRLTMYVDGIKTWESIDKAMIPTKPMHATIQLDQGPAPAWLGTPVEGAPDIKLQVDYLRISSLPGQPA
jgi:beta-glucanase (GH16 family)